ncbi:MAG: hypothetical protein IJN96_05505, partial [Clostridia bacterium]|nr:hypothetical protein [Clostridia bacterium]
MQKDIFHADKYPDDDIYLIKNFLFNQLSLSGLCPIEYTGYILKSPETLNQFIDDFKNGRLGETAEQNSGVFKQLWQAIKDFISNVKKAFKGDKKAQDKAARDTFGMPMSELEKARDLLGAAFAESERVVREKNAPSQSARQTAPPKGSHTERSFDSAKDDKLGEGKKYSIKFEKNVSNLYDYTKSFEEQIEDFKKGKIPKSDTL